MHVETEAVVVDGDAVLDQSTVPTPPAAIGDAHSRLRLERTQQRNAEPFRGTRRRQTQPATLVHPAAVAGSIASVASSTPTILARVPRGNAASLCPASATSTTAVDWSHA